MIAYSEALPAQPRSNITVKHNTVYCRWMTGKRCCRRFSLKKTALSTSNSLFSFIPDISIAPL